MTAEWHPPALPWRVALAALAVLVAVLAALFGWALGRAADLANVQRDLACQVQKLGGQPVDRVNCPPHHPRRTPAPRPAVTRTPTVLISPTVIVVPRVAGGNSARPTPAPAHSSPPSPRPSPSRSPSPSPSPSRCVHDVVTVCLPPGRAPPVRG